MESREFQRRVVDALEQMAYEITSQRLFEPPEPYSAHGLILKLKKDLEDEDSRANAQATAYRLDQEANMLERAHDEAAADQVAQCPSS